MGTEIDRAEYLRLEAAVEAVEKIIGTGSGAASAASPSILGEFLRGARGRMEELEQDGAALHDRDRRATERLEAGVVAQLMAQESRLTSEERQLYGGLLAKGYFTRADFGDLDEFYGGAWDRLSDGGRAEMGHRVWEGVRRGEYDFSELPENVRRREADRLYEVLADPERTGGSLRDIPARDREEFVAALGAGDREKAEEVLGREGFTENASVVPQSQHLASSACESRSGDGTASESRADEVTSRSPVELASASSLNGLSGLTL